MTDLREINRVLNSRQQKQGAMKSASRRKFNFSFKDHPDFTYAVDWMPA